MGLFAGFIEDEEVKLYGVEREELGNHAASLTYEKRV